MNENDFSIHITQSPSWKEDWRTGELEAEQILAFLGWIAISWEEFAQATSDEKPDDKPNPIHNNIRAHRIDIHSRKSRVVIDNILFTDAASLTGQTEIIELCKEKIVRITWTLGLEAPRQNLKFDANGQASGPPGASVTLHAPEWIGEDDALSDKLINSIEEFFPKEEMISLWALRDEATRLREALAEEVEKAGELVSNAASQLGELRSRAATATSEIGHDALVGEYQKRAKQEEKDAKKWDCAAIASLALTALVAGLAFTGVWDKFPAPWIEGYEDGWLVFASRVTVILALGSAIGFFAAKAKNARRRSRELYDRLADLTSLPAFIADLPEEIQHATKAELGRRLYGTQRRDGSENESSRDNSWFETVLKRLLEGRESN